MSLHMQIGEVATRTELSLRTIRYYEEVSLVAPSARTDGGFRLYTEADVARLLLVKRMKPLEFSLDEMRDLLGVLDALDDATVGGGTRKELLDRLEMYHTAAEQRCEHLRHQLEEAEGFAGDIRREHTRQRNMARRR